MTIKQQGGIFGRNPTFNDAEVDDLTVTGSSTLNGAFSVQGTSGKLNQSDAGNVLQIAQGMNTESAVVQVGIGRSGDGFSYIDLFGTSGATFGTRLIRNGGTNGVTLLQSKGTGGLTIRTDDAAAVVFQTDGNEAARFNTSGNLAFPSGQGIDFSATSGTGTSELFDDYEEGLWSPTVDSGTCYVSYGSYIKIGKMVHATFKIADLSDTTTASAINVSLPFTAGSFSSSQWFGSWIIRRYDVSTSVSGAMRVIGGGTTMDFRYSDNTVGSEQRSVNYDDNTSGTNDYLAGSITYFSAS